MRDFLDALSLPSPQETYSRRLQCALAAAEEALMLAKLAVAAGDTEAASAALDAAGEAHTLAQELRYKHQQNVA